MSADEYDRGLDLLAGQIGALWVVVTALALSHPERDALIAALANAETSLADLEPAMPLSDEALAASRMKIRETLKLLRMLRI